MLHACYYGSSRKFTLRKSKIAPLARNINPRTHTHTRTLERPTCNFAKLFTNIREYCQHVMKITRDNLSDNSRIRSATRRAVVTIRTNFHARERHVTSHQFLSSTHTLDRRIFPPSLFLVTLQEASLANVAALSLSFVRQLQPLPPRSRYTIPSTAANLPPSPSRSLITLGTC